MMLVFAVDDLLLVEIDACHLFDPVLVVRHPHVDPGEVGIGTLNSMTHCTHQDPPEKCKVIT
jgi:hypothetical protein